MSILLLSPCVDEATETRGGESFIQMPSPSLSDSRAQLSRRCPSSLNSLVPGVKPGSVTNNPPTPTSHYLQGTRTKSLSPLCRLGNRGSGRKTHGPKVTEQVHVGPGLHPRPPTSLQPAWAPSARTMDLPACALGLKHPLGFLRSRGCSQGHC